MSMKIGPYLEFMGEGDSKEPIDAWIGSGGKSLKVEGSLAHIDYAARKLAGENNGFLVGRDIPRLEEIMDGIPPSGDAAEYWWARVLDIVTALPRRVFWEDAYNELGPFEDPAVRKGFCDFEVRRGQLMRAAGHHCCFLNVSAETAPLLAEHIDDFLPLFELAYQNNDLIGLHAYFSPRFFMVTDDGIEMMEPETERFLFPHRQIVRELQKRGAHVPWFFYTEGPAIDTILQMNRHYDGFRMAGLNEKEYAEQIRWAEKVLHPDPNFVGGAVYIWEKGEQEDKKQYNIATGQPARPRRDDPGMPSPFEFMVAMNKDFGPGSYRPKTGSTPIPQPPPEPPPLPPPPQDIPEPGRFVVSNPGGLNIRRQPNTTVSPVGSLNDAAPLMIDHFVEGEVIKGNPWWGEFGGLYVSAFYLKKIQ